MLLILLDCLCLTVFELGSFNSVGSHNCCYIICCFTVCLNDCVWIYVVYCLYCGFGFCCRFVCFVLCLDVWLGLLNWWCLWLVDVYACFILCSDETLRCTWLIWWLVWGCLRFCFRLLKLVLKLILLLVFWWILVWHYCFGVILLYWLCLFVTLTLLWFDFNCLDWFSLFILEAGCWLID